jgi:signal transduction histidine kinase/CheY-like chemotaxis protein
VSRVVDCLVAPLRLISRAVALLVAALLLLGAWGLTAFLQTAQIERDALSGLTVTASAVAAAIDAPLEHFADLTDGFRATDLQTADRVALTSRLLRVQSAVPRTAAVFLVSATGQLQAATVPFSPGDATVGDADWFRRASADDAMPLTLQRIDSWLRPGPSAVLTRVLRDTAGKPAGLIGAILRNEDLARLVGRTWHGPGVSILVTGLSALPILESQEAQSSRAAPIAADGAGWSERLMPALNNWLGAPSQLSALAPLRTVDATVTARIDTDLALRSHGPGMRAIGTLGGYLGAVWITCLVLAVSARPSGERPVPAPAGFGADWQIDLDKRGCIAAAHGFAPDRLREAGGQGLPTALGLLPEDESARTIGEALEARVRLDAVQVSLATEDGQQRFHRFSITPLPDGSFVCVGRDVTAELRLAATAEAEAVACQSAQDAAASIARDRDRVLTALGHDIRTPMNSIMGICSLLLDGELEKEQRIWLERIRTSCEVLLAMLNGLLEIAGGEVAGVALLADEVDVIGLVQEVADTLRPQARDRGLELKTRHDDLLRGHWLVDPTRLRQVLFNLVGNAIKFTASGHVEIRACTVADAGGRSTIKLAVSDTGPGIPAEDRTRIFDRFKRGSAHENAGYAGLGLGLALCRENAVLMDGTLTVESAPGVGSEFTFEFPAEQVLQPARDQRFAGRTALLIGDEDATARTIANQLGDAGIFVDTAPDGYIGLALAERIEAQRGALDLVIVQGRLSGMAAEVFVLRLRDTAFGRLAVVVWLGEGGATAEVDAVAPLPADPYQVASLAQQLLARRSPFEVFEPTASAARGGRILVVDDDTVNQSLLLAALTRRGFSAFAANDGDEAVRLASRDSFDAILMDIQMPGQDGFEATRRIRSLRGRAATIPIIAVTGLKGPLLRNRCDEAGFTAVLEKPVNLDRLGATLRKWMQGQGGMLQQDRDSEAVSELRARSQHDCAEDVSQIFLEEMVAVVGIERARACVVDFVADASARCMHLGELLPGWEAGAIIRSCEEISGLAETCGAIGLGEVLEEIADAVTRNDRSSAETLIERLEAVTSRLGPAMAACLDGLARSWSGRGKRAA